MLRMDVGEGKGEDPWGKGFANPKGQGGGGRRTPHGPTEEAFTPPQFKGGDGATPFNRSHACILYPASRGKVQLFSQSVGIVCRDLGICEAISFATSLDTRAQPVYVCPVSGVARAISIFGPLLSSGEDTDAKGLVPDFRAIAQNYR